METVRDLLHDAKFWAALVALGNAVLFYLAPEFPREIWIALDGVLAVVIGALAAQGAATKRRARMLGHGG